MPANEGVSMPPLRESSGRGMRTLTPGAQIDELSALLRISEQRRQAAEARLADRERQLGLATAITAELDQQIAGLEAELETLREAATSLTTRGLVSHDNDQLALISECGVPNEIWA